MFFPAFINLENKNVLVVGAGIVAFRKIEKLLPFKPNITVVAPRAIEEVLNLRKSGLIAFKRRKFVIKDLKDKDMVIVAADDIHLQKRIYNSCIKRNILCNSVDSKDYCTFLFPSLIVKEPVVIGINSGGEAPSVSKYLRERLENSIPSDIKDIVQKVSSFRKTAKSQEEINLYTKKLFSDSHL